MTYSSQIADADQTIRRFNGTWDGISAESVARMRSQNRFRTGLDIARYTAKIMRDDMAAYDADPAHYTQSLGRSSSRSRSISARPRGATSICRAG
jgi:isocitrate lyase